MEHDFDLTAVPEFKTKGHLQGKGKVPGKAQHTYQLIGRKLFTWVSTFKPRPD